MAVTSIWSIKGWIGKVINYAENPDKTKENNEGRISENQSRSTQGLNDVITYAVNAEKTRREQSESVETELVGESEELMDDARRAVSEAVDKCLSGRHTDWNKIKLVIRDSMNDYIWKKTKRKPMVIPIIMDVDV